MTIYKNPPVPKNAILFMWATDCEEEIECHLEYEKAEPQTWEHPGRDAAVTLFAAYIRGVDIISILHSSQIENIEEKARIEMQDNEPVDERSFKEIYGDDL